MQAAMSRHICFLIQFQLSNEIESRLKLSTEIDRGDGEKTTRKNSENQELSTFKFRVCSELQICKHDGRI